MLQIVSLTMDNCPICSKRVLTHAKQGKYCSCHLIYHIKCLTFQTEDLLYIRSNSLTWFCKTCITELFSFNHIEHDDVFVSEVNYIGSCTRSIESLSDLLLTHLNWTLMIIILPWLTLILTWIITTRLILILHWTVTECKKSELHWLIIYLPITTPNLVTHFKDWCLLI